MSNLSLILLLLDSILILGGFIGGYSFITDPSGAALGTSTVWLKYTFVTDYFWPGIFLLVFFSILPFVSVFGIILNNIWGFRINLLVGVILIFWIIFQIITIRLFHPLQIVMLLVGISLVMISYKLLKKSNNS